jgi:protoheme ferro-lyase
VRDPCPYCGIPYIARQYFDPSIRSVVRDILDHDCAAFAPVEPLATERTDPSFITEAWNTQEGLARWRESLRSISRT